MVWDIWSEESGDVYVMDMGPDGKFIIRLAEDETPTPWQVFYEDLHLFNASNLDEAEDWADSLGIDKLRLVKQIWRRQS